MSAFLCSRVNPKAWIDTRRSSPDGSANICIELVLHDLFQILYSSRGFCQRLEGLQYILSRISVSKADMARITFNSTIEYILLLKHHEQLKYHNYVII